MILAAKPVALPTMTAEEWAEAKARTDAEWSRVVLPAGWAERRPPAGSIFDGIRGAVRGKTSALFSAGFHGGRWWLHVSIAHPLKLPTYSDLAEVKRIFVGPDRQAVQIFPRASDHVNIHPRALHLWACLDPEGDGLPAFGAEGTI